MATSTPAATDLSLNQARELVMALEALQRDSSLPGAYRTIADSARQLAHSDSAGLHMHTDGTSECVAVSDLQGEAATVKGEMPRVQQWVLLRRFQASPHALMIADTSADRGWEAMRPPRSGAEQIRTWLAFPLVLQGRLLGVLELAYHQPTAIAEEQCALLEHFAAQATLTLRTTLLLAESASTARLAALRMTIAARMWDAQGSDQLLHELVENLGQALDLSLCAVYLQRGTTLLAPNALYQDTAEDTRSLMQIGMLPILTPVLLQRQTISLADVASDAGADEAVRANREALLAQDVRALLVTPLVNQAGVLGVLVLVQRNRPRPWPAGEVAMVKQLATDCAVMLRQARHVAALEHKLADLERMREQCTAFLEHLPLAVVIADQSQQRLLFWNQAATDLAASGTLFLEEGTEQQPRFEAVDADGNARPEEEWPLAQAYRTGSDVAPTELLLRRADGTLVPTLVTASPLHGPHGQVIGAIAVLVDLSRQVSTVEHERLLKEASDRAVREERERLAREIHDVLAQTNTSIVMLLDAVAQATPAESPTRARIEQARSLARSAMAETRRVAWNLRPVSVNLEVPRAVVDSELAKLEQRMGIRPEVIESGTERTVAPEIGAVIQRLLHVALENIWAHSGARHVRLLVDYGLQALAIGIEDDGAGFDPETANLGSGGRVGLAGVAERARLVGGTVRLETAANQGTRVLAEFPYTAVTAVPRVQTTSIETQRVPAASENSTGTIRALLIDDHTMVREGLIHMLQNQPDLEVVGEAATGSDGLRLIADLRPDVVLCDLQLPDIPGTEVIARVHAHFPEIRCLAVTTYDSDDFIYESIKAGAKGYVLKDVSAAELADAVRAAARNESLLQPVVARKLVERFGELARQGDLVEALTEREVEVLQAVASGFRNKEIAFELGLSESTIKTHLASIFGKLNVTTRTEAVARGRELGIIAL